MNLDTKFYYKYFTNSITNTANYLLCPSLFQLLSQQENLFQQQTRKSILSLVVSTLKKVFLTGS